MFAILAALLASVVGPPADATSPRVAVFNIWELSADKVAQIDAAGRGTNRQLRGAAEIIQRVKPDILLINEIDYSTAPNVARLFHDRYLRVGQNGQDAIQFEHLFYEPVNTGEPTGLDLDHDGRGNGPGDAYGYGKYPGQYGMALFSKYPIDADAVRTFRKLRWRDMPGNLMPDGNGGKPAWYSEKVAEVFRLSSKSHWDIPVLINGRTLHVFASHPTPPVFDGKEDRNGRRNFDEIRLWADYLGGSGNARYIVDDKGKRGPLAEGAAFVILGDLNADPVRDDAAYGQPAMRQLLDHPRVQDPAATSAGALGKNKPGPPYFIGRKTCDFGRIDYTLCSKNLTVKSSGVFWPSADDPLAALVKDKYASSDHRMVWVDIAWSSKN